MNLTTDVAALADAEWRSYVEPLLPLGKRLAARIENAGDPQLRQELYRAIFSALSCGNLCLFNDDPSHPDFAPHAGPMLNLLGPNPDFMYYMAPLDDQGTYRLSGYRGTVHMVIVQVAGGAFVTRGDGSNFGRTHNNYYLDDLRIGADGAFDVILSPRRPSDHDGDWWELAPGSTNILLRQLSYDWVTEVDARVAIERLDTPVQRPRPSADRIAANLRQLATWTETYVRLSHEYCERFAAKGINELHFIQFGEDGGMTDQAYLEGMFEIGEDEALILETDVPKTSHYWNFHVLDERWTALDWLNRQTILNGRTARIDRDGKFRAVISPVDPGVANWLDCMGHRRGILQGRWHRCSSYPQPTLKKVKAADVRAHLPPDTATLAPPERDAAIRRLRRGAQMRRRW